MPGSGAQVRLVYIFQLLVLNDKHVLCPGCATQTDSEGAGEPSEKWLRVQWPYPENPLHLN